MKIYIDGVAVEPVIATFSSSHIALRVPPGSRVDVPIERRVPRGGEFDAPSSHIALRVPRGGRVDAPHRAALPRGAELDVPVEPHRAARSTWKSSRRAPSSNASHVGASSTRRRATLPVHIPRKAESPCPTSHIALRVPRGSRVATRRRATSRCASHVEIESTRPIEQRLPRGGRARRARRATPAARPVWESSRRVLSNNASHVGAELDAPVEPPLAARPT